MFGNLTGPTLLVIVFIVLLLFGAPKLPALAKSLGQSMKILKKEVTNTDGDAAKGAEGEGSEQAKTEGRVASNDAGSADAAADPSPSAEKPKSD